MFGTVARRARAPIPVFGISGNYAQAIYSAASLKNVKPKISEDLAALNSVFENAKIGEYMRDPFVDRKMKLSIFTEAAKSQKMSNLTINLFSVLAENNRLNLVGEISEIYARIIKAEAGFTPVLVKSAVKMSAAQEKEVAAAVKSIVGGDANVDLQTEIDDDIVGGLVVSIGDKYTTMKHIDLSTSSRIQKFSGLLKQGV